MEGQIWSWILTGIGVTGWYLAGRRNRWGWAIGILVQILWFAYAIVTGQYGFIVGSLLYGAVAAKNFRAWTLEARRPAADPEVTR